MTTGNITVLDDLTEKNYPNSDVCNFINRTRTWLEDEMSDDETSFMGSVLPKFSFAKQCLDDFNKEGFFKPLSQEEETFITEHPLVVIKIAFIRFLLGLQIGYRAKKKDIEEISLFELGRIYEFMNMYVNKNVKNLEALKNIANEFREQRASGGRKKGKNYKERVQKIENKVTELYQKNNSLTLADVLAFFQAHDLFQNKMVENSLVKIIQKQLKKLNENTSKQTDNLE